MPMGSRKRYPNTSNRRSVNFGIGGVAWPARRPQILPIFGPDGGATVIVTFDQDVILNGTPQYTDGGNQLPIAATVTGPLEITLTFANPAANPFTVPYQDPGVRNNGAGFVLPGSYTGA